MLKIVYNELINRNYEVYIGKTKNGELDFIAKKDGNINLGEDKTSKYIWNNRFKS